MNEYCLGQKKKHLCSQLVSDKKVGGGELKNFFFLLSTSYSVFISRDLEFLLKPRRTHQNFTHGNFLKTLGMQPKIGDGWKPEAKVFF
jgi:hypothetical protein